MHGLDVHFRAFGLLPAANCASCIFNDESAFIYFIQFGSCPIPTVFDSYSNLGYETNSGDYYTFITFI